MSQFFGRLIFEVLGEGISMMFEPFFKPRRAVRHVVSSDVASKRSRRRNGGKA